MKNENETIQLELFLTFFSASLKTYFVLFVSDNSKTFSLSDDTSFKCHCIKRVAVIVSAAVVVVSVVHVGCI